MPKIESKRDLSGAEKGPKMSLRAKRNVVWESSEKRRRNEEVPDPPRPPDPPWVFASQLHFQALRILNIYIYIYNIIYGPQDPG